MNEPRLSLTETQAVVETKTAPRVTEQSIKDKITQVSYHRHHTLTICFMEMFNGFFVVGISACADERNYDADVGERFAYENAFKQLWALEGYLLHDRLSPPYDIVP